MKRIEDWWPLAVAVVLLVVFAGMLVPLLDWGKIARNVEELATRQFQAASPGPTVLLVSRDESDRFNARATVEPRGYLLLVADSTKTGMEILGREKQRIAIVLIDVSIPKSQRLLEATKIHCPHAHVIELRGPRRIGQVSRLLINTAVE